MVQNMMLTPSQFLKSWIYWNWMIFTNYVLPNTAIIILPVAYRPIFWPSSPQYQTFTNMQQDIILVTLLKNISLGLWRLDSISYATDQMFGIPSQMSYIQVEIPSLSIRKYSPNVYKSAFYLATGLRLEKINKKG